MGLEPIYTTTALVFVSFLGFVKIAAVAEEIKNPSKNLPRALIGSVALVTVLYLIILLVIAGIFTQETIREVRDPLTTAARQMLGGFGGIAIIFAGLLATLSSANASIMASSRINLAMARDRGRERILTFGGAYSNHLYATAAACHALGFPSIGVVRGEQHLPLNPTLAFAVRHGMHLHYVSREEYRSRNHRDFIEKLESEYHNAYVIPEGGSNALGVSGCMEILDGVQEPYDVVAVPCGTGATLAGIVLSLNDRQKAIGFSALKGGDFLGDEVDKHLCIMLAESHLDPHVRDSFSIETDYHFGGYGKFTGDLLDFMEAFYADQQIQLDPIYTAKMAYGIYDLIRSGKFARGTRILMIHTGGLQGLAGFEERFGISLHTEV